MKNKLNILILVTVLLLLLSACNNEKAEVVPNTEVTEIDTKISSTFLNTFRGKLNLLTSYEDMFWTIDDTKPENLEVEKPNNGTSNNTKPKPITNNDAPVDNGVVLIGGKRYRVVYHPAVTETIYHPEETYTITRYRQEIHEIADDGTDMYGWSSAQIGDYCLEHGVGWRSVPVNVPFQDSYIQPAWTETVVVQEAWTEYVPV